MRTRTLATVFAVVSLAAGLTAGLAPVAAAGVATALIRPTIIGVAPQYGPVSGGNVVTVKGTGFTAATTVTFGPKAGTDVRLISSTKLRVTAPSHSVESLYVRVKTTGGTSAATPASRYNYVATPRPLPVGPPAEIPGLQAGDAAIDISCPAGNFCAVLTYFGYAVILKDGAWRKPFPILYRGSAWDLSCASARFCAAVSLSGDAVTYNGRRWSQVDWIARGRAEYLEGVSCVDPSFCMAVALNGSAFRYDGTRWSKAIDTGADFLPGEISCASRSLCYALGYGDRTSGVIRYHDGVWGMVHTIDRRSLLDLDCTSPAFCAVLTPNGVRMFTGRVWSSAQGAEVVGGSASQFSSSISCPSARFCVAAQESYYNVPDENLLYESGLLVGAIALPLSILSVRPNPPFIRPGLVSCWAPRACEFVGGRNAWRTT